MRSDFRKTSGWRHTCFLTDQTDRHIARLELRHRQRGRAETVIRDVKACGLDTMPSADVVNNDTWAQLAATALNLCAWTRQLTLDRTGLARATPKTLRYKLFHTAGRHQGRRLDLDRDWAHTPTITTALDRLDRRLPPHTVTSRQAA
ncbi:MAG: transposase [Acidimicrobiia bacterium]|nr:transposase [Acidimicrobiia bacterium]